MSILTRRTSTRSEAESGVPVGKSSESSTTECTWLSLVRSFPALSASGPLRTLLRTIDEESAARWRVATPVLLDAHACNSRSRAAGMPWKITRSSW